MTKQIQVWGVTLFRYGHPNASHHGQVRAIVLARSRAAAARAFRVTYSYLTIYGSPTGNEQEIAVANDEARNRLHWFR